MTTEAGLLPPTEHPKHEIPLHFGVYVNPNWNETGVGWIAVQTPNQNNTGWNLATLDYHFANAIADYLNNTVPNYLNDDNPNNSDTLKKIPEELKNRVQFAACKPPIPPEHGHACINADWYNICWKVEPVDWDPKPKENLTNDGFPPLAIAEFLNQKNLIVLLAIVSDSRSA